MAANEQVHLIVVGGGLAGLTAAATAARAGKSVIVLDQANAIGGRARTQVRDGVHFNLGPHALYKGGHALRVLKSHGVTIKGKEPSPGRTQVLLDGKTYPAPVGFWSLLTSPFFSASEKWRLAGFFRGPSPADTRGLDRVALGQWLGDEVGTGRLKEFLLGVFRVTTYAAEPERLSAGAALDQFRIGLKGVLYLDGGWQSLIDGLRQAAIRHGVEIRSSSPVEAVRGDGRGVLVRLADGTEITADHAVLAVDPRTACELLDVPADAPLSEHAARVVPALAASLDVALTRLPRPQDRFALGLDQPLYFSVHSAAARLGPPDLAVLHVMKYLAPGVERSPRSLGDELEAFLDRLQPGWRSHVARMRFLPRLVVSHDTPRPETGGLGGRPKVGDTGVPNVFLAGDWVGPEGMLADASAASAEAAALATLSPRTQRSLSHAAN